MTLIHHNKARGVRKIGLYAEVPSRHGTLRKNYPGRHRERLPFGRRPEKDRKLNDSS